jgi:hypothetical protein
VSRVHEPPIGRRPLRRRGIYAQSRGYAKRAVQQIGVATAGLRVLPDFLIIGAQRCGTTSLYGSLGKHPAIGVCIAREKEVHYFDVNHDRGPAWYRSRFPTRFAIALARRRSGAEPVVGEATPDYMFNPLVPERVQAFNPQMKLIVLVRDPVKRAVSHYYHEVAGGRETLPLREALEQEPERLARELESKPIDEAFTSIGHQCHSYVARGFYREQIERWLERFPRDQLLILPSEELFDDASTAVEEVHRFLGVEPRPPSDSLHRLRLDYVEPEPGIVEKLARQFDEANQALYDLLGRDLGWTRPGDVSRAGEPVTGRPLRP